MKTLSAYVVVLFVLGASVAVGQVIYNNASTAGESYARGASDVIQAQGQRNLSNSQAAINLTDARSNQIDNQVKSVNAFWEKKDIYSERQQQEFYEIGQDRSAYVAKHGLKSLTPDQFDRTTGKINWPKVLYQKQYDPYRNTLDELFDKRAKYGMLSGDEYMAAMAANKEWRAMLTKQKDVYPGPIFDQIMKFILGVRRELADNLS
ncbi:MAG: hypothetical protein L0Z07_10135 [Planctomycetes bacterium]|nr:hypothetical protein [Planctomycetota bacterium]